MSDKFEISVKGLKKSFSAWEIEGVTVVNKGNVFKTAEIFDEYWIEKDSLPNPEIIISALRKKQDKPNLFTFAQRVPDTEPLYNYLFEWDNVAVLPVETYDYWIKNQVSSSARRNIKASMKRGVKVSVSDYNEEYIRGIMSIYNESPIRHRKRFWHYGKNFETVKRENGTYRKRSTYLAAYYEDEMIGYLKIVWDKNVGAIMQILSRMAFFDKRPNNALLAEAVRQCDRKGVEYLLYESFTYGKKGIDSLTRYKKNHGFIQMNIPRYFVPLNWKGSIAIKLGLYKSIKERMPEMLIAPMRELRTRWYEHKILE